MRIIQNGLIIAGLALAASASAEQGATDFGPTPEMSAQGAYIGIDIGGVNVKYADNLTGGTSGWDLGNWSAGFGGDLGYQFNTYMAIELGGSYILPSKLGNLQLEPWYAYAAAKIMVPFYRDAVLFAKAGVNYLYQSTSGSNPAYTSKKTDHNWGPMFAVGMAYVFSDSWSANVTYTRLAGTHELTHMIPSFNIVTAGVDYKFAI